MKNLLKDLGEMKMALEKVQKNLQRRMERAFPRGVERLVEIAASKGGYIQKGDTGRSLRESGQYYYMCAGDKVGEAVDHLKKAISFVEKAEKQPKKRMSPKKK